MASYLNLLNLRVVYFWVFIYLIFGQALFANSVDMEGRNFAIIELDDFARSTGCFNQGGTKGCKTTSNLNGKSVVTSGLVSLKWIRDILRPNIDESEHYLLSLRLPRSWLIVLKVILGREPHAFVQFKSRSEFVMFLNTLQEHGCGDAKPGFCEVVFWGTVARNQFGNNIVLQVAGYRPIQYISSDRAAAALALDAAQLTFWMRKQGLEN